MSRFLTQEAAFYLLIGGYVQELIKYTLNFTNS